MSHVVTIARKEVQEAIGMAGKDSQFRINMIILPSAVILFTLQGAWTDPENWAWSHLVFISPLVTLIAGFLATESFTGERERHTLETLLASPASERSILLGKVLAHFLIAATTALGVVTLQLTTALVSQPDAVLQQQLPRQLSYTAILFLHLFLFMECVGIFIGQRATTMVGANAALMPFFFIPAAAVGIYFVTLDELNPGDLGSLPEHVSSLVNYVVGVCYGVCAILFPLIWTKNRAQKLMEGT